MNMQYPPVQFTRGPSGSPEMDKDLAAALDRWRLAQNPPLGVAAAVHELLRRALRAEAGRAAPVEPENDSQTAALIRAFMETRLR